MINPNAFFWKIEWKLRLFFSFHVFSLFAIFFISLGIYFPNYLGDECKKTIIGFRCHFFTNWHFFCFPFDVLVLPFQLFSLLFRSRIFVFFFLLFSLYLILFFLLFLCYYKKVNKVSLFIQKITKIENGWKIPKKTKNEKNEKRTD